MRGALAGLLAVIGIALVPLADVGVWTRRELLPRDEFVALGTQVLDEDEVRVALSERITEEIDDQVDLSTRARSIVEPAVEAGLTTEPFREVYRRAIADVHDQVLRGEDRLVLRFAAILPLVRSAVADIDAEIAAEIPEDELPDLTIITEDQVPTFFHAVELVRRASLAFPIACLVVLVAAVGLARRRGVALAVIGAVVGLLALLLVGVVELGRDLLSQVTGPDLNLAAFEAGYDVVTHGFVIQTLGLALLGGVGLVGGIALQVRKVRSARPIGWA